MRSAQTIMLLVSSVLWMSDLFSDEQSTVSVSYSDALSSIDFSEKEVHQIPKFASQSIYPSGNATIFGMAIVAGKDLVILDNGLDQGFRNGMICEVSRQGQKMGEIILVEVQRDRSAALIIALENDCYLRYNDTVSIKTKIL